MLEALDAKRPLMLIRDQDVGGELLTQYQLQGTVASVVIPFLWRSGAVLWYVSINFGRATDNPDGSKSEHSDEERTQFIQAASELSNDTARCRLLATELKQAYDSIR